MERNYVITIRNETSSGGNNSPTAQTPKSQETQQADNSSSSNSGMIGKAKVLSMAKIAENFADKIVSYNMSTISLKTGQVHYQQKLQFTKDIVKQSADTLIYTIIGASVAGLPGAIFGVTMSGINSMINVAQKQNTINIKRDLENVTIRQNNIRAGSSGNRIGTAGD